MTFLQMNHPPLCELELRVREALWVWLKDYVCHVEGGFSGGLGEEPRPQLVRVVTNSRDACGTLYEGLNLKEGFREGRRGGEQSFSFYKRTFFKENCLC